MGVNSGLVKTYKLIRATGKVVVEYKKISPDATNLKKPEPLPENFAEQLNNMVNSQMNFGDFSKSVDNLYTKYDKNSYSSDYDTTTISFKDNENNVVAKSYKTYSGEKAIASIADYNTGRTYSTGWQERTSNNSKFTTISGPGYKITDNGNGYVDANDNLYIDELNTTTTVGEYLNSQS